MISIINIFQGLILHKITITVDITINMLPTN
ncbi:MAG: hypothetical protein ACJAVY_000714, partial [Marinoscillum sp.]